MPFITYRASAGSGKTYTLALKYIAQLLPVNPEKAHRSILAVTFTNDATGEMKERILAELYDLAYPMPGAGRGFLDSLKKELPNLSEEAIRERSGIALNSILNDYHHFNVTTIDSFFQKVVRNLAKELGIGSRFEIETDTKMPVKEAVQAAIDDKENLNDLMNFVEEKFEDDRWDIQWDLEKFGTKIFDESFQKNEKQLSEQLKQEPYKIENMIRDCKAIRDDFEEKMKAFADQFDTYRAKNPEAKFHYNDRGIPGYFKKIKNKEYAAPNSYAQNAEKNPQESMDLLQGSENYRTAHISVYNSAILLLKYIYQLHLLSSISQKVHEKNKEENRFILAGANSLLSGLMGDDDASFVFEKIGAPIRSIIIDEFQDTSELQWKNFHHLISEILSTNGLGMLLGDVKQSIYRWRNSDWKILNHIETQIPKMETKTLGTNYRSAKNIVEYNNGLFKAAAEKTGCEAIRKAYHDVEQKVQKNEEGYVSVEFVAGKRSNTYKTDESENVMLDKIAEKVEMLLSSGVKEGDICILCRKNEQIRQIANKLSNCRVISEDAYQLKSSKGIRLLISALKIIAEPKDSVAKAEVFTAMGESVEALRKEAIQNVLNGIDFNLPLYELVEALSRKFNLTGNPVCSPFLFSFMDKLAEYISKNTSDVKRFLEYWEEKLGEESLPLPVKGKRDGILIMTVHKSKGLQFHSVIVPFVDWPMNKSGDILLCGKKEPFDLAMMPVEYGERMKNSVFQEEYLTENEAQKMDNLNVLYVALTRAENNLVILARKPGEKSEFKNIQDFIKDYIKEYIKDCDVYNLGAVSPSKANAEETTGNPFRDPAKGKQNVVWNANESPAEIYPNAEAVLFARGGNEDSVKEGNTIHYIFENISTFDTVETAVQNAVSLGMIPQEKSAGLVQEIKLIILQSGKEEWFSGSYEILNECSILTEGGKEKRPDRVMFDKDKNAIVVDYKTGKEMAAHKKQICEYTDFLLKMGYPNAKAYLWYLNQKQITEVESVSFS
jgi:ATP-dependent exoDNAse (exonuclease V) beta subunit